MQHDGCEYGRASSASFFPSRNAKRQKAMQGLRTWAPIAWRCKRTTSLLHAEVEISVSRFCKPRFGQSKVKVDKKKRIG